MGARGPVSITRETAELRGNPGNRPIKDAPRVAQGAPMPPSDLSPEAFAEWCRIVPDLEEAGILARVDRGFLVAYCEAWANFCDAREAIREHGTLVRGRDGGLVKNPATQVMKESMDLMLKYGSQFGLSPNSRARMAAPAAAADDSDPEQALIQALLSGG